jgi:hypothetical protein
MYLIPQGRMGLCEEKEKGGFEWRVRLCEIVKLCTRPSTTAHAAKTMATL